MSQPDPNEDGQQLRAGQVTGKSTGDRRCDRHRRGQRGHRSRRITAAVGGFLVLAMVAQPMGAWAATDTPGSSTAPPPVAENLVVEPDPNSTANQDTPGNSGQVTTPTGPRPGPRAPGTEAVAGQASNAGRPAGVRVVRASLADGSRVFLARVRWDRRLVKREGSADRFVVRLLASGPHSDTARRVVTVRARTQAGPRIERVHLRLTKKQTRLIQVSDTVIVAATQLHRSHGSTGRYTHAYVATRYLKGEPPSRTTSRTNHSSTRETVKRCRATVITYRADLTGCDLSGAHLNRTDISASHMRNTRLIGARLNRANLTDADFTNANFTGATLRRARIAGAQFQGASGVRLAKTIGAPAPGAQFIRFAPPPLVAVGSSARITATSTGNGRITYATTSPDCAVNPTDGTIDGLNAGTFNCTITATAASTDRYAEAHASHTLSIRKGGQTISFTSEPDQPARVGTTYSPTATGGPSNNPVTYAVASNPNGVCELTDAVVEFLVPGTCTITARQVGDRNYQPADPVTQTVTVTDGDATPSSPHVTEVNPTHSHPSGGVLLTITGDNFTADTTVTLGEQPCHPVTVHSPTHLSCTTPPGTPGPAALTLTTPGAAPTTLADAHTYAWPAPEITAVSPTRGPATGGTPLTLTGTGFHDDVAVTVGGQPCRDAAATSPTTITCVSPTNPVGTAAIVVTNSDDQSTTLGDAFTYLGPSLYFSQQADSEEMFRSIGQLLIDDPTAINNSLVANPGNDAANDIWPGTSGVVADASYIYWANPTTGTIGRAGLDGSNPNASFITGANGPQAVAIDGQYVYWSNTGGSTIGRANLDGSNVNQAFIATAAAPFGIAVDATHIYWPNSGNLMTSNDFGSTIGRANLDGTGVIQDFVTGASGPQSVAVSGPHIYWINQPPNPESSVQYIGHAEIDPDSETATQIDQQFIFDDGNPDSLAADNEHLYYSRISTGTIAQATLDGSNISRNFALMSGLTYGVATDMTPRPTSVSPATSQGSGGATITISGTGFAPGAEVLLGTTPCSVVSTTYSTIECVAGAADAAQGLSVIVSNPTGASAALADAFEFTTGATPTITSIAPTTGPTVGGTSVTISGDGFISGATVTVGGVTCSDVEVTNATSLTCATGPQFAGPADVVITNPGLVAGTAAAAFTYDVSAPTIASVTPESGPITGGTSVTISGAGFETETAVTLGGVTCPTSGTVTPTSITCTTPAYPQGAGPVELAASNGDGLNTTMADAFTFQASTPTLTSVSPTTIPSAGVRLTVSGEGFVDGATVAVNIVSSPENTDNIECAITSLTFGTIECLVAPNAGLDGESATVVVTNPTGPPAEYGGLSVVQGAPVVTGVSPASMVFNTSEPITITGDQFYVGYTTVSIGEADCDVTAVTLDSITCTPSINDPGTYPVVVTVTAPNRYPIASGSDTTFTYSSPPVSITSPATLPVLGPVAGNESLAISGENLGAVNSVTLGNANCSIAQQSDDRIVCTTSPHPVGVVDLTVSTGDGQQVTVQDYYSYLNPGLAGYTVSPASGPAAGGTNLTITGTGFTPNSIVKVGGQLCTSLDIVSDTTVTCTSPPVSGSLLAQTSAIAGLIAEVDVANPDALPGTGEDFMYTYPAPTGQLAPGSGVETASTPLTITGSNLFPVTTVTVGGEVCADPATNADFTELTCTAPPGPRGTVDVTITTPGADPNFLEGGDPAVYEDQVLTLPNAFSWTAPTPVITNVTPTFGPTEGGTPVTITGTGFVSGMSIAVGGQPCVSVTVTSLTEASCTTSAAPAGPSSVVAINPGPLSPTGTLTNAFTFHEILPTLTDLSEKSGSTFGRNVVTITGTNFFPETTFTFGGAACTALTVDAESGTAQCTVPAHAAGAVDVVATNPGPGSPSATQPNWYTYISPTPTDLAIAPDSGPASGGTAVTISGSGFDPAANVTIGGAACLDVVVNQAMTEITCSTGPAQNGKSDLVVTNTDGRSGTAANAFTYELASSALYYTNIGSLGSDDSEPSIGNIGRANLDGTGAEPNFISVNPAGVEPDWQASPWSPASDGLYIYYLNQAGGGSIGRASIDGRTVDNQWIPSIFDADQDAAIAIDDTYLYLLTSPMYEDGQHVLRFKLDDPHAPIFGSNPDSPFISGIGLGDTPSNGYGRIALAINPSMKLLVWTDRLQDQFGAALLPPATETETGTVSPDDQGPPVVSSNWMPGINEPSGIAIWDCPAGEAPAALAWTTLGGSVTVDGIAELATPGRPINLEGSLDSPIGLSFNPDCDQHSHSQTANLFYAAGDGSIGKVDIAYNVDGSSDPQLTSTEQFITATEAASGTVVPPAAAAPSLEENLPAAGPAVGGNALTLTGTGLTDATQITVGGMPCPVNAAASQPPTTLVCQVPPTTTATDAVDIVAINPDGQSSLLGGSYTYQWPSYLYWGQFDSNGTGAIARADLDGSSVDSDFISGSNVQGLVPASVAVNSSGVYWINSAANPMTTTTIGRANLDGSSINNELISNVNGSATTAAAPLTVDENYIYWLNCVPPNGTNCSMSLARASIDGTHVDENFIPHAQLWGDSLATQAQPAALAVTTEGIYWADANNFCIGRADLDGSNLNAQYICPPDSDSVLDLGATGDTLHFVYHNFTTQPLGTVQLASVTIGSDGTPGPIAVNASNVGDVMTATSDTVYIVNSYLDDGSGQTHSAITTYSPDGNVMADPAVDVVAVISDIATHPRVYSPPTVTSISPATGSTLGGTTVTISGTGFQPSAKSVTIGGSPCTDVDVVNSFTITCTTGAHTHGPVDFGPVDVYVQNADTQSGVLAAAFDYEPPTPVVQQVNPNRGMNLGGNQVSIVGNNFDPNLTVTLGNTACTNVAVLQANTVITCTAGAHAVGTVDVVVANPNNRTATKSSGYTYTLQPPVATSVSPAFATVTGGSALSIRGRNFAPGATVTVGESPCPVTSLSANSVQCTLPAATSSGPVNITVANTDGNSTTLQAGQPGSFTYLPDDPTITAVSPTTLSTAGGDEFTVQGTGFISTGSEPHQNPRVSVGDVPCVGVTVADGGNQLTCTTQPSRPGSALEVSVINPPPSATAPPQTAQSPVTVDYVEYTPSVTGISPLFVMTLEPEVVVITGSNFDPDVTVSIGQSPCTIFQVTPTHIQCRPVSWNAGPGLVDLEVSNPGAAALTLTDNFVFTDPTPPQPIVPTVSGLSPTSGLPAGGETLTISGNDFSPHSAVFIGMSPCRQVQPSPTEITCTLPAHAPASDLVVTVISMDQGVAATATETFSYADPAPTLETVQPASGPTGGNNTVTLTGSLFSATTTASVGGTPCKSVTLVNSATLECVVPASSVGAQAVDVSVQNAGSEPVNLSNAYTYTTTGNVFWANSQSLSADATAAIGQLPRVGGSVNPEWLAPSDSVALSGLAVDDTYIYWTDSLANSIGRARLDGTGAADANWIDQSTTSINNPTGVLVHDGYLYWANTANNTIGRATLPTGDNTEPTDILANFISGDVGSSLAAPTGIATDGTSLYWGNNPGLNGDVAASTIAKAPLDGSASAITLDWLTLDDPSASVASLTLDDTYVYWVALDAAATIGRAPLTDPTEMTDDFVAASALTAPQGVRVTGTHIYWTDTSTNSIGRAALPAAGSDTATDPEPSYVSGAAAPYDVILN